MSKYKLVVSIRELKYRAASQYVAICHIALCHQKRTNSIQVIQCDTLDVTKLKKNYDVH